jgi:hypothetical protein
MFYIELLAKWGGEAVVQFPIWSTNRPHFVWVWLGFCFPAPQGGGTVTNAGNNAENFIYFREKVNYIQIQL